MRFWTIQPREIWEQIQHGQTVRVDPNHPKYGGKRPWQYEWLSEQLPRYRSGFDGGWPWWLSCLQPDLDRYRMKSLPGGMHQALIELELPEERHLVFPLWMWETIHMGKYLALNREELDDWHQELWAAIPNRDLWPLPEPWLSCLEKSWIRMFDGKLEPRCWYRDHELRERDSGMQELMAQASEDQAGLTQVLLATDTMDVTLFTAHG